MTKRMKRAHSFVMAVRVTAIQSAASAVEDESAMDARNECGHDGVMLPTGRQARFQGAGISSGFHNVCTRRMTRGALSCAGLGDETGGA